LGAKLIRSPGELAREPFDLLVVGGGILGASIARDAALRGLRVALVERGDWGSGTSSNSLKIVHGGLRYLQHLDVRRCRESMRERSTWLRIAPHLVEPLPVVVPAYRRGGRRLLALRAAAYVGDLFAPDRNRGVAPDRLLPAGRVLTRAECLDLVPELGDRQVTGGILIHDAQMYSSERLVLETVESAALAGAEVANYLEVAEPLLRGNQLAGVIARDPRDGGERVEIRARAIVLAAGPATSRLADRLLERSPGGRGLRYTLALNLGVVATGHGVAFTLQGRVKDPNVLMSGKGRQLFVVPWRGRTLIGTAHLPYDGDPADFRPGDAPVQEFLEQVNDAWPGRPWAPDDVRVVHAGLLPGRAVGATVRLDKRPQLLDYAAKGATALLSVSSVKFTTARKLAEHTVDRVCRKLGIDARSRTAETPLPGAPDRPVGRLVQEARRLHPAVSGAVLENLVRTYGKRYPGVLRTATDAQLPEWLSPLEPHVPVAFAQLVHAARFEMALTPDDVVQRRTDLVALSSDPARARKWGAEALSLAAGALR
jgi:glycerol-3-phosphate dehydrogenase